MPIAESEAMQIPTFDGTYKMINEHLTGQILAICLWLTLDNVVADSLKQVCLAQSDRTMDK